jgi:vWA domain found in the FtsH ternary systems/N-terminal helical region fused to the FtsH ternary system vWA domain
MDIVILRDPESAQRYLLQGLWLQRAIAPSAGAVKPALEWALEIAGGGQPLPPVGFVADLGHAAFGADREVRAPRDLTTIPGLPPGLARTYEDHVLGKVYADWTFERASDALRRYQGRERVRGLAYVVKQMRERAGFGGVELSPGIVRTLADSPAEELLRRGWDELSLHGPLPLLIQLYEGLIAAARRTAEVLAPEDVIALEQRTALADMGQYVAHRQVLQMASRLEMSLPRHKVRPLAGRREVPTRVLDEDTYPVGGFASLSTRGSIESLLQSQLAYMEQDRRLQPDLFDVKYLRDELYYYSRDENQFLRRRRTFLFVLYPDLVNARFKDAELPAQRIVLLLALLVCAVRKLSEWLGDDALVFEFLFVHDSDARPLAHEANLMEMLFREQLENGTVKIEHFAGPVEKYAAQKARRSLCHCLAVSTGAVDLHTDEAVIMRLQLDGPRPLLDARRSPAATDELEDPFDSWTEVLERLLQVCV